MPFRHARRLHRQLLELSNVQGALLKTGSEWRSSAQTAGGAWLTPCPMTTPSTPHPNVAPVACMHTSSCSSSSLHTAALWRMPQTEPAWEDVKPASPQMVNPFAVVQAEVDAISERLRHSVASSVPSLSQAAGYFFRQGVQGKRLRPTLVMLMASALSADTAAPAAEWADVDTRPAATHTPEPRRRQQRVAEVAEIMHVASLLHDDVIDDASTRRGVLSVNAKAGNKLAILAGDFLLARASVTLAALQNTLIVELMSNVLENLVCGEVMQMAATQEQCLSLQHYLDKTYCKTASLMANSLRSAAVLGDQPPQVCELAWEYGRHLGLAFQVVDDVLDLTASASALGKPSHSDLRAGLATAPVLFAAQQHPELGPLIARRFKHDGDVARAVQLLNASTGIQQAQELAKHHCRLAVQMIESLPAARSEHAAEARAALIAITDRVLTRKK